VTAPLTGAQLLLRCAGALGVRACFANPGTTELALVRALEEVKEIRPVLGLFEGVCTGAADGYGRIAGVPALTLLHLGPGLANGLANLHNARRAHTPIVNIVGDHATWHLPYDAPLTSDIAGLASWASRQVIGLRTLADIPNAVRTAIEASCGAPGAITTIIAPSDLMEDEVGAQSPVVGTPMHRAAPVAIDAQRLTRAAQALHTGPVILLLGGDALNERGQRAAARIAAATGARLIMESYPAVVTRGGGLPYLERLAYFPQDVITQLGAATVVLAGALAPVSYFGYPGQPSQLVPGGRLIELSRPGEDGCLSLESLADLLGAPASWPGTVAGIPAAGSGTGLTPMDVAEALVLELPEGSIVSVEGSTCGGPYLQSAHRAAPHTVMTNTGGAIGQGVPCGLGGAIARPGSRVVCLQSDGSAQYTLQALWTIAREGLDVTVIIAANHRYGILQTELRRAGADVEGAACARMTRLDSPRIDWVALARGYGVPAERIESSESFQRTLRHSLRSPGPTLIECQLA
jgi:acetolactate synthase-1/2/3 large subunit